MHGYKWPINSKRDGGGTTEGNSGGITLFNVYGTTEGTVYQMSCRIPPFAAAGRYPAATDVSAAVTPSHHP